MGLGCPSWGLSAGSWEPCSGDNPSQPVNVRVSEFGESARTDLQERQSGPRFVTLQFIGAPSGRLVDELQFELNDREQSDAVIRIPHTVILGG